MPKQNAPTPGEALVFPAAYRGLVAFGETVPELAGSLPAALLRLQQRVGEGHRKYGTYLMTHNGRDALRDAWEEAADLLFYLQQAALERAGTPLGADIEMALNGARALLLALTLVGDDGA